ncbi:hypothetical protein C8A03DRAFT_47555 [Achaetomium macrosporum]|uniref:Knr4/Smi1-like domain-containing protein n=1 Tax=Achaetomium macrosporum TaxID=79813 RepID=A0AAN7C3X4_9PEZI|nr:hypothetical protein C8A03DRAFT_47555 [Achaetomium macrosporum]
MSYHCLLKWRRNTSQMKLQLRDKILTGISKCLQENVWHEIFQLYLLGTFSELHDPAKALLEAYFDVQPGFTPTPGSQDKEILGLLWKHCPSAKPGSIPWDVAASDEDQDDPPEYGIRNPAFFQLHKWTETHWISQTDYGKEINDEYDPHQWKISADPWAHAICARLLCRVLEGQVPDRAAVCEAFEAVDRLFTQLPKRGNGMPHCHIFHMKVYFALAVGLGERQKARDIFALACTVAEWCPDELLPIPALYEVYFGGDDDDTSTPSKTEPLITEPAASTTIDILTSALAQRKQNGQQDPLHGIPWPELLRRFSEAAFQVHRDEYAETDDPPQQASDILLPPITPEELAEVEQPLPDGLIANGFKGAWHFMGGGFPGVDKLCAAPSGEYGIYFDVMPEPKTVVTSTGVARVYEIEVGPSTKGADHDAGPVWVGYGAVENNSFEHVVCPPETWRKLAAKGVMEEFGEGEYRVIHFAYWEGGGHKQYKSMRNWIASETDKMERELELEGEDGEAEDGREASEE